MAVAKTIADDILAELNHFSLSGTKPDAFTSARLKREIGKLGNVDFIGHLLCDAILATIDGRKDDAFRNFTEILKYQPDSADMHQNFGYSLAKFRRMNEAHEQYLLAVDSSDQTMKLLADLAESSQIVFRPGDLTMALERNEKKVDFDLLSSNSDFRRALKLAQLFKEFGIDEDEANQLYTTVEQICEENSVTVVTGFFRVTGMQGGSTLSFYASIEGDSDFISEMNLNFCDKVIDNDQGHILKDIAYVFVPINLEDEARMQQATDANGVAYASHP